MQNTAETKNYYQMYTEDGGLLLLSPKEYNGTSNFQLNKFLLAAKLDDVEFITTNIKLVQETDRYKVLNNALHYHSLNVVEILLKNLTTFKSFFLIPWLDAFEALGQTKGCEKKRKCFDLLMKYGSYFAESLAKYIMHCIFMKDTKGALQALKSCELIYNLKLYDAAKMNNRLVFFAILPKIWEKENLKSEFLKCIQANLFDFAFYILEFCKEDVILWCKSANKLKVINFLKYMEIYKRSRVKAANKIYFWWIHICYRKFGKKFAEKSYMEYLQIN